MLHSEYSALFTPAAIGGVEMKNRIAMAPMSMESIIPFENGYINSRCKEYLIERAKGGVGMIILSCWCVDNTIEPVSYTHLRAHET